jgi:hypothetical protein
MARKSRSISKKLNLINVLIENVNRNEEVKTSLFGFGYAETPPETPSNPTSPSP